MPSSADGGVVPRTIVFVVTRMIVGGAQETARATAEHFHRQGDRVLLITGPELGREGRIAVDVPTLVAPWLVRAPHPVKDLHALWSLYRIFRRERPDVVHSRTAKARFLTGAAARLAGVPAVVQTIHGFSFNNEVDRRRSLYIFLERLAARFYHRVVLVSEADKEEGAKLRIVPPEKVTIVRSGCNVDKMRNVDQELVARVRSRYAPHGEPVVTLVGRLSPPKTPETFVEAADLVRRTHPQVRFLLVGDGPKREHVAGLIERLDLGEQVAMLGLRPEVGEIMAASDVIVHSSTHEGLPKTVLEGMAAGKPVVATRVGGVPSVVRDEETGLLVDELDPCQLAVAITRLVDDRRLCERVVANASRTVQEFTLVETLRATEALYGELLDHAAGPARRWPWWGSRTGAPRRVPT